MISDICLEIIRNDGIPLGEQKELEVKREIELAISQNRFMFIFYEAKAVGFMTWHEKPDGIFFNNLFVLREFRHKNSLLGIRKHFKGKRLIWHNRKRNKEVSWDT